MSVRSRTRSGPLAGTLTLGLALGVSCGDDQGGDPPDTSVATTTGPSTSGDTTGGGDTTSGGDSSSGGGGSTTTGEADSTGMVGPSDPNLDRSAPNILDDPDLCGYPGPGPGGYGGLIEQNRFPNFVLEDCDGNQREFAEFFCQRDDPDYMDYNHVFIVMFETVW